MKNKNNNITQAINKIKKSISENNSMKEIIFVDVQDCKLYRDYFTSSLLEDIKNYGYEYDRVDIPSSSPFIGIIRVKKISST